MHYKGFLAAVMACTTWAGASSTISYSTTTTDTVIKAVNNNTGGQKKAIVGTSSGSGGVGVEGRAMSGGTAIGTGVHGQGITGVAANGTNYGVWATGNSSVGVYGQGDFYGMEAYSANEGVRAQGGAIGVFGIGNWGVRAMGGYGDEAYGLHALAYNASITNYGVYSYVSGPGYAGYFDGDVVVTGSCNPCSPSDERLKKDIQPMTGALNSVMALKPKTYTMRTDEFKGKISLAEGKQYGLIAQELEKVLPEMVKDVRAPAQLTPEEAKAGVKKAGMTVKAVNYAALVPILIAAIQEQQAEIEALKRGR